MMMHDITLMTLYPEPTMSAELLLSSAKPRRLPDSTHPYDPIDERMQIGENSTSPIQIRTPVPCHS